MTWNSMLNPRFKIFGKNMDEDKMNMLHIAQKSELNLF